MHIPEPAPHVTITRTELLAAIDAARLLLLVRDMDDAQLLRDITLGTAVTIAKVISYAADAFHTRVRWRLPICLN